MHYFEEIANTIRWRITNGIYTTDHKLPKQTELAQQFQTSRVTIQKALDLLQIEGIIYSKKGVGTFVNGSHSTLDYNAKIYGGMTRRLGERGKLTSQIISFDIMIPDEIEQAKLKLKKDQSVYNIIRLRKLNGEPLALEYTIMPVYLIPGITEQILSASIYQYITNNLQLTIGNSSRRIRADKPDAYDQKYLDCGKEDPILEVEQIVYLEDEIPFEYSQTRHRYDKGDFIITNVRGTK